MIAIVGATLPGLAAAARLARAGHQVVVLDEAPRLPVLAESPLEPDPSTIALPAAWRDLFKKSGRPLDTELNRHLLSLEAAPPTHYTGAAGGLDLPHDRAGQWHALSTAFGLDAAEAWRDLVDGMDETWQALRRLGIEAEFPGTLDKAARQQLRPHQSLADLAAGLPPALAAVVTDLAVRRDSDPRRSPGWLASRLAVERTFGRWQLTDDTGAVLPVQTLVELLEKRLRERGVQLRWNTSVTRVSPGSVSTDDGTLTTRVTIVATDPWHHLSLLAGRDPRLARSARRLTPAVTAGPRWQGWKTLLDLPGLRTGTAGVYHASSFSPAGPELWAQLLTGALVAYRVHEDLTGEDMRPTNKAYKPPRPSQARTVISTSTNMSESLSPE